MTDDEAALELLRAATALPTDSELECVDRAIEIARASGLRLPPDGVVIRWRRYTPGAAIGCCEGTTIYLAAGLRLEHLTETALHEVAHLHDFSSGRSFPRAESEARAVRYAARMIAHWRSGTLPSPPTTRAAAPAPKCSPGAPCAREAQEHVQRSPFWGQPLGVNNVNQLTEGLLRRVQRLRRCAPKYSLELGAIERGVRELDSLLERR